MAELNALTGVFFFMGYRDVLSGLCEKIKKEKEFLRRIYLFDWRHTTMGLDDILVFEGMHGPLSKLYSQAEEIIRAMERVEQEKPTGVLLEEG